MAKDISDKKLKKEKKEKKEKRVEAEGVSKTKKDKKSKGDVEMTDALDAELEKEPEMSMVRVVDGEEPRGALVPFAFPLSDEPKELKKVLKTIKKSAKTHTLRRGVKEVVKTLRKSNAAGPASSDPSDPFAVVIIAADISPMDVIAHLPVLCEDHSVPYIYIRSRAALGDAAGTKRPTSVVMINKKQASKSKHEVKEGDAKEFDAAYEELVKLVANANRTVKK